MHEKTAFGFKFHGDEVRDGTIQVEDFAATASAIAALVQEANRTLNGGRATERHVREYETWLRVVSITFEGRSMWQFKEDGKQIKARAKDKDFWNRVRRGRIQFRSGTSLKVVLETVTTVASSGSRRTRRAILRVLDVEDHAIRQQLGFDEPA